jgi:hypothetical protein
LSGHGRGAVWWKRFVPIDEAAADDDDFRRHSFSAHSCMPEQVRTTLTTLFERSGTTPNDAKCLAA